MGDPTSRRNQTRNRLRAQLRKKRESLADQFDFKIYIAFVFKEKVCPNNRNKIIACTTLNSTFLVSHHNLISSISPWCTYEMSYPVVPDGMTKVQWPKYFCLVVCLLQKKKSALFEVAEVVPVMTNNYEENILRGVRDSSYSLESSIELLQKDVVQLHAPRYQSMRRVSH